MSEKHHSKSKTPQSENKEETVLAPETLKNPNEKVELSAEEYAQLTSRVKEAEELKEKFLRSAADYENAKKRLIRERDEFAKFAQESFIRELLPILDNFERALAHADQKESEPSDAVISGIQMVLKQLNEILKTQGVKRLTTVGEKFDPNFHEAIGYVEQAGKEDEIVDEIQAGYMLHDRLLRAAKVRVRMAPQKR